ncbi:MAG TPA: threonine--tRNA ligase [Candidatus Krumholzibacteria bacterium]|nr:threonine--tRNA ligase [Candidatus Krumholzibacteria bacterium]HPD71510.1 threonine--tRNA ligase [Candidatus Krumholzibacteria bacterium]HRY41557.1 threonine--tRNA ligase [Candidatus Krumholzibacteria bacterium]
MSQLTYRLPDGNSVTIESGETYEAAVRRIGEGLLRNALAVRVDGVNHTLTEPATREGTLQVITRGTDEGYETLRHSTAHLMAWAVQELFPGVKFAFGPSIENGFYYDFDRTESFSDEELALIEAKMAELARRDVPVVREIISREDAERLFADQPYKLDQIRHLSETEAAELSIYRMGSFVDLCEGPHVPSSKELKAFKLLSVAGAYWRGDSSQPMLQRIYGTSWFKKKELDDHLRMLEEAKKRDHRKLGRELDLFGIFDEAGPGLSYWYPRGDVLREQIIDYWKAVHRRHGYVTVTTPHISQADLWETSGHMQFYRDNMFVFSQDDRPYVVKPMNCPGHILMYKRKTRGYRSLPVRYAELGTVYRAEIKGALHGLMRVRGFTQDDAHIFCTPAQLEDEVCGCIDLVKEILGTFGFHDFKVELSVRDPENKAKYAGTDEEWEAAERSLVNALGKHQLAYTREEGEAVFYGPKIDVKLIDAIGRRWQTSTIQFDFNLPRRFDVTYTDHEGQERYAYMVHRAIMGSLERFIGVLTEHFAGDFPLWLAPEQARVLSVSRDQHAYARTVADRLRASGLRVEADVREEKIGFKIREAETMRVPFMLVVGGQEQAAGTLAVRQRHTEQRRVVPVEDLAREMLDEIARKA